MGESWRETFETDDRAAVEAYPRRVCALMRERAIFFPWRKSDVLVPDNVLVADGRNSFEGEWRMLVALA